MAWTKIEATLEGVSPTIMKNGQTADPLNSYAKQMKEITGKRKKTDDDYATLYKLEYMSSLYLNEDGKPYWPEDNLMALIVSAAKSQRGMKGLLEGGGLLIPEAHPLEYDGPTDPEKMFADPRFVLKVLAVNKNTKGRIITCRPIFRKWRLPITLMFEPSIVNKEDVMRCLEDAGQRVGLACWRPRYGRFVVHAQ